MELCLALANAIASDELSLILVIEGGQVQMLSEVIVPTPPETVVSRVHARGRFLFSGPEKFSVRGVTYGPFGEIGSQREYGDLPSVQRDFAQMVSANVNAVRTYTVPPPW